MRTLEIRRHSFTKKGEGRGRGSHLSDDGVRAARQVGAAAGRFERAWASTSPRTMETAIAMGVAVDDTFDMPSPVETGAVEFHEWRTWPDPFTTLVERSGASSAVSAYVAAQGARVLEACDAIGDGDRGLIVGHGGWIESVIAALVDPSALPSLGGSFWHLDAIRLSIATDGAVSVAAVERFPRS